MMAAVRTDVEILLQSAAVEDFAASGAPIPHVARKLTLL
jgi:hypothetical protein